MTQETLIHYASESNMSKRYEAQIACLLDTVTYFIWSPDVRNPVEIFTSADGTIQFIADSNLYKHVTCPTCKISAMQAYIDEIENNLRSRKNDSKWVARIVHTLLSKLNTKISGRGTVWVDVSSHMNDPTLVVLGFDRNSIELGCVKSRTGAPQFMGGIGLPMEESVDG